MKKLLFISLILTVAGCSLFGDEPNPIELPNVWDPESDFYKKPETILLIKPALLIGEHATSFKWTSTRTGSPTGIDTSDVDTSEYVNITWSYRLNEKDFSINDTSRTVSYTYLTDTLNIFEIRTHYPNGETEEPPTQYKFRVDNIKGPTLRFHPRKKDDATVGIPFTLEIYAEEVTGLTGTKIVLEYSLDSLRIGNISPPADTVFFLSPNGETTLFLETSRSDTSGIIILNMALAGGETTSVSGTGKLAILSITPLVSDTLYIRFSSESIYRDSENREIIISSKNLIEAIIIAN